jgi:hypothetical protein
MAKVRRFGARVIYEDGEEGRQKEESFTVRAWDVATANRLALAHTLQVLKLDQFELRVVAS